MFKVSLSLVWNACDWVGGLLKWRGSVQELQHLGFQIQVVFNWTSNFSVLLLCVEHPTERGVTNAQHEQIHVACTVELSRPLVIRWWTSRRCQNLRRVAVPK